MGSGIQRIMVGSVIGTGADLDVRTVGYRPSVVKLYNEDGLASAVWLKSMADGECLKTITAGTMSKVTTTGITPLSDGFRIGADTDLNVDGEKVHYVAEE